MWLGYTAVAAWVLAASLLGGGFIQQGSVVPAVFGVPAVLAGAVAFAFTVGFIVIERPPLRLTDRNYLSLRTWLDLLEEDSPDRSRPPAQDDESPL